MELKSITEEATITSLINEVESIKDLTEMINFCEKKLYPLTKNEDERNKIFVALRKWFGLPQDYTTTRWQLEKLQKLLPANFFGKGSGGVLETPEEFDTFFNWNTKGKRTREEIESEAREYWALQEQRQQLIQEEFQKCVIKINNLISDCIEERKPPVFEKAMVGWRGYYRSKKFAIEDYKKQYCQPKLLLDDGDPVYALVHDVDYFFARLSIEQKKMVLVKKVLKRYRTMLVRILKSLSIEGLKDFYQHTSHDSFSSKIVESVLTNRTIEVSA